MPPITITILGAGIAGLTAALALRKNGHHVTLLEKASTHQEVGAAILQGPNCSGILMRLGFQPERAGANLFTGWAQYDSKGTNGGVKMRMDLREVNKQWSNPWLCVHRADLYRELKRLAMDQGGEGPVPVLELGCKVVDIDADAGVVKLEGGSEYRSDVVLGADGNFSFARKSIEPEIMPHAWGKTACRWLVPRETLTNDSEMKELIGPEGWLGEVSEGDRRIIIYSCRDNTEQNFVAIVPNEEATVAEAEWNHESQKSVIENAFRNFSQDTRKLLSYAPDTIRAWKLYDMKTLTHWSKGRLALIGDAAHPFLPFLGQGGAMAIEDAASIAQVLPSETTPSEVPERLKLYEDIRQERATWIQEQTRNNGLDEEKRPATKGGFEMLLYCHNHDEWENSRQKLEEHLKAKESTNRV